MLSLYSDSGGDGIFLEQFFFIILWVFKERYRFFILFFKLDLFVRWLTLVLDSLRLSDLLLSPSRIQLLLEFWIFGGG